MSVVNVKASRDYKVTIGSGVISQVGTILKDVAPGITKALVVSDTNTKALYADKVKALIEAEGIEVSEYTFEAGEQSKNIDTIAAMWGVMAKAGFTRTDAIVSVGGGVAGDMSGFAAATFLRGIKVVQVPTSLLAMVDACVGGKTGIDLKEGKNLVGAFHQPSAVIEDADFLASLSDEVFTEGMAEVIKYACIMDTELYEILKEHSSEGIAIRDNSELMDRIVTKCVSDKAYVIEVDEHDNGLRQTLNFGHTIGHVIERNSHFQLAHGVCVAKGMGIILDAGVAAGRIDKEEADKMKDLIAAYGLPVQDTITPEDAVSGALNDKKKRGNTISLIVVDKIGEAQIVKMTPDDLLAFLKGGATA